VANGLAGTDMPMAILPGGSANVVARSLGIPNDVVDATEHLLSLADEWEPRKVDLGRVDQRYFVFACGAGIDATVVKRVDSRPKLKARFGPWFYSWAGVSAFYRRYLVNPVRLRVAVDDHPAVEGVTAITQNSDPFTYFSTKPVYVNENVAIDSGTLSMAVLKRATQRDMPTLLPKLFSQRKPAVRHRQIVGFEGASKATIESISEDRSGAPRSFQLQVDGDYIGERTRVELGIEPGSLTIIA
jgi:diacylglycerol kinase family enzyme